MSVDEWRQFFFNRERSKLKKINGVLSYIAYVDYGVTVIYQEANFRHYSNLISRTKEDVRPPSPGEKLSLRGEGDRPLE